MLKVTLFYKEGDQPFDKNDKVTELARKHLFLSSCPFNLEKVPSLGRAPSRKSYYQSAKASPQLIKWLEDNNCDTIYCRELRTEELTCKNSDAGCVPEFASAYAEALRKLNNKAELARRWVTNYAPLNSTELRTGFYKRKKEWLDGAVLKIEDAAKIPRGSIKTTMTDRQGVAYFYDLCPGTYYISNIAPVEIKEGESFVWETEPIKLKKQDESTVTAISLANVDPKDAKKKNKSFFVSKKVTGAVSSAEVRDEKSVGQQ